MFFYACDLNLWKADLLAGFSQNALEMFTIAMDHIQSFPRIPGLLKRLLRH